jgi:chemotaxis protein CheX
MNAQTCPLDIRHYLNAHLVDVFQTMLSINVTAVSDGQPPKFPERVTGSVGFGGDTVTGGVYLNLSSGLASQIAAAMLGLPPDEAIGEAEVNDVIGECTNMLAGGLKSALCDSGCSCAVSTPAIIRGTSFAIESLPGVRRELLVFDHNSIRFSVEVHIKFNQTH